MMKTITMVMRCGVKNSTPDKMYYTCIADDYSIIRFTGEELVKAIVTKQYNVTNMGVEAKGLVATNGAMDKYTLINPTTQLVEGQPRPVILNRVEAEGKLIGYTIFNANGILQEVKVKQATVIHGATPFANGKIRHTNDGDIIQSIEGNYPIRVLEVKKAQKKDLNIDLVFIGSALNNKKTAKYAGLIISCENAAMIAKLYAKAESENTKIMDEVFAISGEDVYDSLRLKRTSSAGIYVVLPIEVAFELIKKADNKVSNKIGNIMISCVDYEGEVSEESRITLSHELKPIKADKGSLNADNVLRKYTEEVLGFLKKVTIKA